MCVFIYVCVCVLLHKVAIMRTAWFGQQKERAEDVYKEETKQRNTELTCCYQCYQNFYQVFNRI